MPTVLDNLPTGVFVRTKMEEVDKNMDIISSLEAHAHEQNALVSSEAFCFILSQYSEIEMQMAMLDRVIALTKARYPKEGDWIVINKEKLLAVLS